MCRDITSSDCSVALNLVTTVLGKGVGLELFPKGSMLRYDQLKLFVELLIGHTFLSSDNHDMSTPKKLAEWDQRMINTLNTKLYFQYIIQTVLGKGSGDRV
ncbi:hypothetical protein VCRA2116O30_90162 [Vibrio crassostreae]|uniref:Uncharacterized protein n=1 Tax=Vibrio crassostreae TaxID=246167 RepID=A0ABP1WQF2_9VIBR|nr:hypothetical protein VCRA2119O45_90060 [Vibrio crassostreae]CAK2270122.1 hypothetical protein VCRA2116O30_90162 [Vibrio crassostreae]CAK2389661.1 hypothetical protein VCRA2119O49_90061 [Vibrio crassostreae]CAK2425942.1 hypothetical protein VCRA2119O52_150028 [Vibrio crassostreae]CAK2618714.1 hypothetical protein VCRA2119O54_90059 [Vibrio crassostreae]